MKRSILVIAFALLGAASAQAGDFNNTKQIVVRYADLNVKEATGARELLSRIDAATEVVCGPAPDIRDLAQREHYRACTKTAMDRAVQSLPFDLMAMVQGESETIARR